MKPRRHLRLLLLLAFAIVCSCSGHSKSPTGSSADQPPGVPPDVPHGNGTGSVEGRITDCQSGAPVTDARVVLVDCGSIEACSPLTPADAGGHYRIGGVRTGRYVVLVQHRTRILYDQTSLYAAVDSGATTIHDLRLQTDGSLGRNSTWIAGTVLNAQSGAPVAGAFVTDAVYSRYGKDFLDLFAGAMPAAAISDSSGRFLLPSPVAGGNLGLSPFSVTRSGYEPFTMVGHGPDTFGIGPLLPPPPAGDSALRVTVRLEPLAAPGSNASESGALRGRILFANSPVPGITVGVSLIGRSDPDVYTQAMPAAPVPDHTDTTDAEGKFLIGGLPPGRYVAVPAFLPDDRYLAPGARGGVTLQPAQVAAADTADAGDLTVLLAIDPISPFRGEKIDLGTPVLSWTPVPPTPGVTVFAYDVWFSTGSSPDRSVRVAEASWQVPDSLAFRAGACVRWTVDALIRVSAGGHPHDIVVASFETPATFAVR